MIFGWDDPRTQVSPDAIANIANEVPAQLIGADPALSTVWVRINGVVQPLRVGAAGHLVSPGLRLAATEFTPLYRVSAATTGGIFRQEKVGRLVNRLTISRPFRAWNRRCGAAPAEGRG